jgi:outer membrane receptor protein involved in Fe transport
MGAARFNHSSVVLRDQLGTDLNGDHAFTRLNPAAGLTFALSNEVTAFGSFSMSSRVPAPSELSCADPDDPCRLPNAFVADPPLDQVVASTWEGGIRGHRPALNWSASVFRTANNNDIMFISSGPLTNTGHFENVGDTLRQGFEMGASGTVRNLRWGAAYSFLHATFGSDLTLSSPNHPDEEDGEIEVEAGDAIPGVPGHNLKANVSTTIRRLTVGGNLVALSGQYLRGDEANLLSKVDGFAVVNLNAQYAIGRNVRIRGRVANLIGTEYETFGVLGEADEVLGDDYDDPRFLSPGAPRAGWIGLEFSFR